MPGQKWTRRQVATVIAATIIVGALACTQIDNPFSPKRDSATQPGVSHSLASRGLSRSVIAREMPRLDQALREYGWLGDAHNQVMDDLWHQSHALHASSSHARCEAVLRTVMNRADALRGMEYIDATHETIAAITLANLRKNHQCAEQPPMTMFRGARPLALVSSVSMQSQDEITQSGIDFGNTVADAMMNATGGPADVASAANDALATGTNLSVADYSLGDQVAALGVASANYWWSAASSGSLDADSANYLLQFQMSIFHMSLTPWWGAIMRGVRGVDIIGCTAGFAAYFVGGGRSESGAGYSCWIGGAAASGIVLVMAE